jgi:hypothetical protein
VPRRGPEAVSIAEKTDFHGSGENIQVHACFYRDKKSFLLKILSFYNGKYFRVKKQEMVILF